MTGHSALSFVAMGPDASKRPEGATSTPDTVLDELASDDTPRGDAFPQGVSGSLGRSYLAPAQTEQSVGPVA